MAGLNVNQQNVADALDGAFDGGASLPPNFASLFGLTDDALASALTEVSGEASTGARQTDFLFNDMFLSLCSIPIREPWRRIGQAGSLGPAPGCTTRMKLNPPPPAPDQEALGGAGSVVRPHWTVWGAGFGGGEQLSGTDAIGSHDTSTRAGGFAAGADYHVSPEAMLGFALAGGGTSWSLSGGLGGGHSHVFEAGLYGFERSARPTSRAH